MAVNRIDILRGAITKVTQILAGQTIIVTQSGVNAFVQSDKSGKPVRVNLPYIPDNADDNLIDAVQGFLDHEVAHILFSDFHLLGKASDDGLMIYLNALEDPRIEILMAQRFEGSAWNLKRVGEFYLSRFVTPAFNKKVEEGNSTEAAMALMVPAIRAWAGQDIYKEYMEPKWPLLAEITGKLGSEIIARIGKMSSCADAYEIASLMKKALEVDKPKGEGKGDGASGDSEKSKGGAGADKDRTEETEEKMDASRSDEKDAPEEALDGTFDTADSDGDALSGKSEDKDAPESTADDSGGEGNLDGGPEDVPGDEASSDDGESLSKGSDGDGRFAEELKTVMKELDFEKAIADGIAEETVDALSEATYLVYSKDEDEISPLRIPKRDLGTTSDERLKKLQSAVDHLVAPLQKDLERAIVARSYSTWIGGHRSGRLHSANLARLAVGDNRVFRRKHQNLSSKDVAVSLVIDCSGSMTYGGSVDGTRIQVAAQAAYAMSSVLDRLQIPNEVIGFTTKGNYGDGRASSHITREEVNEAESKLGRAFSRHDVIYMPIVKGFSERMTVETKRRFAHVPHIRLSQNVDGECIEIAAKRLGQRRETGRIMMVLSDGEPACNGDWDGQMNNLREVTKRVEASGIRLVGIGIQTESVEQFYSKSVVLNEIKELPGAVVRQLKELLVSQAM